MFCLVREFLEFFNLDFTISVYEPETYLGTAYNYEGRYKIIKDLGLSQLEDNSHVPLILQLIKLTQLNKKTSNVSEDNEEHSDINIYPDSFQSMSDIERSMEKESKQKKFNETFDVSNSGKEKDGNSTFTNHISNKTYTEKEDTFNDISSAAEDVSNSVSYLINLDKSVKSSPQSDSHYTDGEKSKSLLDQSIIEQDKLSPTLKDVKLVSKYEVIIDKIKSPQKSEKLKAKSNLSSLSDLPPLQINKSRDSMVLPSLYSKDYKDRKGDLDKFIDADTFDNYEEDFMSSGELELGLTKFNINNINDTLELNEKNGDAITSTNGVNSSNSDNGIKDRTDTISEELHTDADFSGSASK